MKDNRYFSFYHLQYQTITYIISCAGFVTQMGMADYLYLANPRPFLMDDDLVSDICIIIINQINQCLLTPHLLLLCFK